MIMVSSMMEMDAYFVFLCVGTGLGPAKSLPRKDEVVIKGMQWV